MPEVVTPDPSPPDSSVASTNGWDTVAAITYREVNKAITQYATYPSEFSDEADDKSVAVSGKFVSWAITNGGSGPLIHMSLTVENGNLTAEGETAKPFSGAIVIELSSAFIPQQGKPNVLELNVNKKAPVVAINAAFQGLSKLYAGAAKDGIVNWLNKNLDKFNHAFATVNLDRELVKDGIAWLAPSFQGYAVAEPMKGATLDNSAFGVMCLIDSAQPGEHLAEQISPFAIPDGHKAGFLISDAKFLQHIMLPGLGMLFDNVDSTSLSNVFDVAGNGTLIRNKAALTMREHTMGTLKCHPVIDAGNFIVECGATEIRLSALDMHFDVPLFGFIKGAMTAKLTYSGHYRLKLTPDGHVLALEIIREASSAGIQCSQAWTITQIVLGSLSVLACLTGVGFVVAGARAAAVSAAAAGSAVAGGEAAALGAIETGELVGEAAEDAFAAAAEAMTTGAAQGIEQAGINFAAAARISFATAGALGLAPSIGMIQNGVAQNELQKVPPVRNLIDQGLAKIVQFPATLGHLDLTTARLNQSLQLGMK